MKEIWHSSKFNSWMQTIGFFRILMGDQRLMSSLFLALSRSRGRLISIQLIYLCMPQRTKKRVFGSDDTLGLSERINSRSASNQNHLLLPGISNSSGCRSSTSSDDHPSTSSESSAPIRGQVSICGSPSRSRRSSKSQYSVIRPTDPPPLPPVKQMENR